MSGKGRKRRKTGAQSAGLPAWALWTGAALLAVFAGGAALLLFGDRERPAPAEVAPGRTEMPEYARLFAEGRTQEAVAALHRAVEEEPEVEDYRVDLAYLHIQNGRPDLARELLLPLTPKQDVGASVWMNLGMSEFLLGSLDQAEQAFVAAGVREPSNAAAHFWTGRVMFESGKVTFGTTNIDQGRLRSAIAALNRSLELDPANGEAHLLIAQSYDQLHEPEPAVRHLETLLRAQPQHAFARAYLGLVLYQSGQVERAEQEYRASVRLQPNRFEARLGLGQIYHERGDNEAARTELQQAVALSPDNARSWYLLSVVLTRLGDQAGAERARERFMALDKEYPVHPID